MIFSPSPIIALFLQISEHGGKLGLRLSKKLMEMMKTLAPPGDQKVYAF